MADETRTQPTEGQKKDLADAIANAIHATLSQSGGSFYLEVGPDKRDLELDFGAGPGAGGMAGNQFECVVLDDNLQEVEDVDGDDAEEWQDVLVVTVRYDRRRGAG